jgi:2-keto-4-pentenoate hydratase/2-oxohepta-3-ene-1,7-dioic acid hydratase in catechol pathway
MKIICIHNNYPSSSGIKSVPEYPVYFLKPESALLINNYPFFIPDHSKRIIPKVNVALKICRLGKNIQEKFAHLYYDEISIGIDMEATDTLAKCIKDGLPWEPAKAYDSSAPIGNFASKNDFGNLNNLDFSIHKNGNSIVKANTSQLIFSFESIIAYVSTFMTLKTGDYLFTGSPVINDVVEINDKIECFLVDKKLLSFNIK